MSLLFIAGIALLGLVALYFLVFRRTRAPSQGGRPDQIERPELSGAEQQKHREPQ
jgi:hypothetical protein